MNTSGKDAITLSPLMRTHAKRKNTRARLAGTISKARAREWIRHIKRSRRDWE